MPSAVLLSIAIHAALFFLAGMLVVFTVVKKKEIEFEPPKAVERPKMKLKKPKVKVKKTSKPKQAKHILAKVKPANMPEIQLPELGGMGGEGLGEGIVGGFDMMPDLSEPTLFGSSQSIGNDLIGSFYDFKRDRSGRNIPFSFDAYINTIKKFVQSGWKTSKLARFYQSPKKLYATCIMVPPVLSPRAPEAFGEPDTPGYLWVAHYKGQLVHKEDITFRFWGMGDSILIVRVDGKVVLNASWGDQKITTTPRWQTSSPDSFKYYYGHNTATVGDWIALEAGVPLDMEILIGESRGGMFVSMLSVEVEGVEYEEGPQGNPILPMFKTATPSLDLIETIHADLVPGEVSITNGPVFCDFDTSGVVSAKEEVLPEPPVFADTLENEIRIWTLADGKSVEAEFTTVIGGKVVLKDTGGKIRKVPLDRFSDGDRVFVELAQPPKFNIDFSKKSKQHIYEEGIFYRGFLPDRLDYVFSARLKQTSAGAYNHELKVEFFAIGEEIDGDNYILFDRQESRFTPNKENNRSHEFSGKTVKVLEEVPFVQKRGSKYGGYLVVVMDERGVIVDVGSSHKWLPGIVGKLRVLPVGKHFDKTGSRVLPPCPEPVGVY
ncbi:MAG: SHD1 domain-containing protein [Verrucomicrobiota bacterium]